jgi:hypothetical protein
VAVLVIAWMLGVGGVMNGCGNLQFFRQTTQPVLEVDASVDPVLRTYLESVHTSRIEALNAHHGRMIPLAAADALLSGLLIVACARALSGRPRAHHLALQAIAANILYAIADFVVSAPVREAILRAASLPPPDVGASLDQASLALAYSWGFRLILLAHLFALGAAAFALTRPRVLTFYRADPTVDDTGEEDS